jgi:hypothetical protein
MPVCIRILAFLLLCATPCLAIEDEPLEEIVVTGEFKGPGLWRVTRPGDTSHVLWIVGDPFALPKRMQWKSRDIEAVALASQEILRDAAVSLNSDEKIGVLRGLTLVPALMKARKNPEDQTLEDLLPPDLHARWVEQKRLYLRGTKGLEDWRPLFAADRLRARAFEKLGLRERGVVWDVIGKLVEKQKIPIVSPRIPFVVKRAEVRGKIKEFSRESLTDIECFRTTLDLTRTARSRQSARRPGPARISRGSRRCRRCPIPIYRAPWRCSARKSRASSCPRTFARRQRSCGSTPPSRVSARTRARSRSCR